MFTLFILSPATPTRATDVSLRPVCLRDRGRDRGCQRRRTGGHPGGRSCGDARILPQGCTKDSRRAVFNAWHMSAAIVKYVQCWCSVACSCTGMAVLRHIQAQPGMSTLAWSSHAADHSYHAWPAYCVRLSLRTLLFLCWCRCGTITPRSVW